LTRRQLVLRRMAKALFMLLLFIAAVFALPLLLILAVVAVAAWLLIPTIPFSLKLEATSHLWEGAKRLWRRIKNF